MQAKPKDQLFKRQFNFIRLIGMILLLWGAGSLCAYAKPLVALDAGHGGNDSGCRSGNSVEKEWNLKIAQALQKAFQDAGFDVVMVRSKDETIPLEKRAEVANSSGAFAVLSIHADREWTGEKRGPLLVVEPPNRTDNPGAGEIAKWGFTSPAQYRASLRLGKAIAEQLGLPGELSNFSDSRGLIGEASSPEGGVLCEPHQSLRYLTPPAVALVPLFLTSAADLKKFSNADGLADFTTRVVRGTSNFLQGTP